MGRPGRVRVAHQQVACDAKIVETSSPLKGQKKGDGMWGKRIGSVGHAVAKLFGYDSCEEADPISTY